MKRVILCASAIGLVASSATAMPMISRTSIAPDTILSEVKIICAQDGHCYRRGRRPVVRWIYGDSTFYGPGPYVGPGNYGDPARHWTWWPFFGF
jgi:hypothetical protein